MAGTAMSAATQGDLAKSRRAPPRARSRGRPVPSGHVRESDPRTWPERPCRDGVLVPALDSAAMSSMPKRFPDRVEIASVRAEAEPLGAGEESQEKRRLAGRVMGRRDMGKLVFLDLVDRSGRIQLLCDTSRTGELDIHLGDVVGVTGSPARPRRREPSLAVDAIELLSRIQSPLPDTFHGLTDVEARHRRRHLDLLMN